MASIRRKILSRLFLIEGNSWIYFKFSNTSIGISTEDAATLFDEFTQVENAQTRDDSGTGLGLSISRKFCRLMGGEIELTSKRDVGSTFTVLLPNHLPTHYCVSENLEADISHLQVPKNASS